MWMLVEWQTEKPTSTYDVVRLSSVICDKNEVQEGEIVFVLTKNDYSAMRARVLMISDDKRTLKTEKEILEKRELELKAIVSTCMQSIRKLDMQRPHGSTADLKAGLPSCTLKYAEPKKESDASSSSSVSSSSFDENHLHNVLMANRESFYSGADRLVKERREIRNRHKHRRRHYKPSLSQPRTCSTPLQLSTLPQVSPPVPHLISPLVPTPVMHQVAQPVSQSVPWPAAPHPLCVDQGTQTEVPYPKPTDDYIKQMKSLVGELMERQRTMIARFFETVIKGTKLEPMFKHLCNEKKNSDSEYLVNGQEECNGEYEESEHYEENGDNEIISENEENGHNVSNNVNYINGVNGHNDDNGEHGVNGDDKTNDEDEDNRMDWINGDSSVNITDNSYKSSESSRKPDTHFGFDDSGDDMVPIGNGYAEVPRRLLRDMNWAAYSTATRQLLHAIFPRKVLATHSLTGRPSPAFTDKPAKQRLNQDIVNDIVKTVTQYCKNVTNSMVRSVITITCTDEAKLFRNRQKFKKQRQSQRQSKDTSRSTSEQSLASNKSHNNAKNSHNSKKNVSPHSGQYISSDNITANASTGLLRPDFNSWSQLLETSSE